MQSNQQTYLACLDDTYKFEDSAEIKEIINTEDVRLAIVLDRTIFYPQGGGQPADTGIIQSSKAKFLVTDVRLVDGRAMHYGNFLEGNFASGDSVKLAILKERRMLNARLHSAGHLIDIAINKLGLVLKPGKGYHFPDSPYVEYEGDLGTFSKDHLLAQIQNQVQKLIAENQIVKTAIADANTAEQLCCSPLPEYIDQSKPVRVVTIGDSPGCPCGGTHVKELKDINELKITKIRTKAERIKVSYVVKNILLLACLILLNNIPTLATNIQSDPGTETNNQLSLSSEEEISNEADALYWQGLYKDALPLYARLAVTKNANNICDSPVQLHHLANLADCYCRLDQYEKARGYYQHILASRSEQYGNNSVEICKNLSDLAACDYYQNNYAKAEVSCEKALKILDATTNANPNTIATLCLELGQIYYARAKYNESRQIYERAIKLFDQSMGDVVEPMLLALQGAAASCYNLKQYDKAAPILERIAGTDYVIHGGEDVRYGWALMNLSDVYTKLGIPGKSKPYHQKCIQIFHKVNIQRILAAEAQKGTLTKAIENAVYKNMFGHMNDEQLSALEASFEKSRKARQPMMCLPGERSLAKPGPWNLKTTDQIDPPVCLWFDPKIKQRARIICIHGLGLHARTYDGFARQMSAKGFTVLALDMRGFGTYASVKGKEKVDFDGCLEDIKTVLNSTEVQGYSLPTYILGESMGGAIALQFTAKHPDLVDGLICSVPAGNRYKSQKTNVKVALHLVKDKNRPFDIGKQIVAQATDKESLKQAWQTNPFNRLRLSPKELVDFQSFMNQNKNAASKIKDRPVIFFQGGQDKLIKATGTMQIFKEIASKDKDLILLGSSEHLVFEESQAGPAVIYGVIGWILAHLLDQEQLVLNN